MLSSCPLFPHQKGKDVHILFIDESGTAPNPKKVKNKYFVIGGIIIPEAKWRKLSDLLQGLKIRRKLRGELKWRYFAIDDQWFNLLRPSICCSKAGAIDGFGIVKFPKGTWQ